MYLKENLPVKRNLFLCTATPLSSFSKLEKIFRCMYIGQPAAGVRVWRVFGCVVVSVFEATTATYLFDNALIINFYW